MRAVVMRDFELLVDDIPQPEPREGDVLVKTLACGICGSDLHFLKFAEDLVRGSNEVGAGRFSPDLSRDIVMGHEFCCEVIAYGPNTAATVPVGERCVSVPSKGAYSNVYPGGYSEFMLLDAAMILPVDDALATQHAATTEPMAVGLHAARAGGFSDEPAVIYGCGPVGLATIGALKLEGVGPIVAADFSQRRRELAGIMGADSVVDPRELSPITALERLGTFSRNRDVRRRRCARHDQLADERGAQQRFPHRRRRRLHAARPDSADGRHREGTQPQVRARLHP